MQYFFITGASRGIGKALVERILQVEDTFVFGFSRHADIQHERYRHHHVDLSDIEHLKQEVSHFFSDLSDAERIVLVNNAGTLGDVKYFGEIADDQIQFLFNLNVTAPAILMNHFFQAYRNHPAEKIMINVSSGAGKSPVDGWSGYCASKAALDMLSQVAALEVEKAGGKVSDFKVYALAPGVVDTAMQAEIRQVNPEDFSNLDKFLNLKEKGALDDAARTAEKFMYLIDHSSEFNDVLQDVRKF